MRQKAWNHLIFIAKGYPSIDPDSFPQRLARSLNRRPPAWPLDEDMLKEWQTMLEGWWESDPAYFLENYSVDVDRAVAVILFRHRDQYPPHPQWTEATPRAEFARWRDTIGTEIVKQRMPELLELTCQLMESVEHPVLNGSELGTTPKDSWLTQMALYRYPDTPRLRIMVLDDSRVSIHERRFSYDEAIEKITLNDAGEIELAPELQPGWRLQQAQQ